MTGRIAAHQAEAFRSELAEGYSLTYIAKKWGVSEATVKRHASYDLAGKKLLVGTEVHVEGWRGRWRFMGEVGYTVGGRQHAKFGNVRTGRTRIFYTELITTVHRK